MTQRELDRAVARVTGEDLREIRRRGFSCCDLDEVCFDPEPDLMLPQVMDWDDYDLRRNVAYIEQPLSSLRRVA